MTVRYCPKCGGLLTTKPDSRFVNCPEHGRLIVTVSQVNQ